MKQVKPKVSRNTWVCWDMGNLDRICFSRAQFLHMENEDNNFAVRRTGGSVRLARKNGCFWLPESSQSIPVPTPAVSMLAFNYTTISHP